MSLFRASIAVLSAGLKAAGGVSGTYRRSNAAIEGLVGVPAATQHIDYGTDGVAASVRESDWIFWAAELVADGELVLPVRGDLWIVKIDGAEQTYEVEQRGDDRTYRHTDQTQQQLRVYMHQIPNIPETDQ